MQNFLPPKNNLDLEDIGKILNFTYKNGLLDDNLIISFLTESHSLAKNVTLIEVLTSNIKMRIQDINGDLLISHLQACFWDFGQKNDTGFLIYTIYYLLAKKKYPEMMAFAYKKLGTESSLVEKLKEIILRLKSKFKELGITLE